MQGPDTADRKRCVRLRFFRSLCLMLVCLSASWPAVAAEGPAVEGRVTVLDRNGNPKEDQSGVVVFLDELENEPSLKISQERAVIDQAGKKFIPEVLPIQAGTVVDFPNNDTIYHNVFSLSRVKPFDLGLYAQGASDSVTFDEPGLVKVYCNIHSDMIASIVVLSNPYFTVTDREGHFVIKDVPQGSTTVRTWHSRSKEHPEAKITVTADGVKDIDLRVVESLRLEIKEEALSVKHKNKWGQDYPSKY